MKNAIFISIQHLVFIACKTYLDYKTHHTLPFTTLDSTHKMQKHNQHQSHNIKLIKTPLHCASLYIHLFMFAFACEQRVDFQRYKMTTDRLNCKLEKICIFFCNVKEEIEQKHSNSNKFAVNLFFSYPCHKYYLDKMLVCGFEFVL